MAEGGIVNQDVRLQKAYRILKGKGLFDVLGSGHIIRMLDVGCAQDPFYVHLPSWWDKRGFDQNGGDEGSTVVKGDINTYPWPFEDMEFDVLFLGEIIEHAYDTKKFLRECNRILAPGGTVIITTPNLVSLKNRFLMLFGFLPRFAYQWFHVKMFILSDILRYITDVFHVESVTSSYVLYSHRREKLTGPFFEWLGDKLPTLGEHFIFVCRKK